MFVFPEARGLKLGRRLLERIEEEARREGLSCMRLETGIHQPEALGLYRSAGYVEREAFGEYRPDPLSVFMEKSPLTAPPHAPSTAAVPPTPRAPSIMLRRSASQLRLMRTITWAGNGVDVGTDSPSGEGERIRGVPEAAPVVRDTEMKVAALRVGAPLGSPAESRPRIPVLCSAELSIVSLLPTLCLDPSAEAG